MQHRNVRDVMTEEVVTVGLETPFKEIVAIFHRNDITAVPVVDDYGRPLGMVSEADLLGKEAALPDPAGHSGALGLRPIERARAEAETAGGVMTSPLVTARPAWSVPEAARRMQQHHVKRLPVVDEAGRLVGIVSRRDLLQLFLRSDAAICEEIDRDVLGGTLRLPSGQVRTMVNEGVVTLTGRVPRRTQIPVIDRLCLSVDGVVALHQTLEYDQDDTQPHIQRPSVDGRAVRAPRSPAGGHRAESLDYGADTA
jgi:CBS domain-containing protein